MFCATSLCYVIPSISGLSKPFIHFLCNTVAPSDFCLINPTRNFLGFECSNQGANNGLFIFTSGSFGMNISISYVTQSLSFFGNFLVIGVRGRIRRI
jgi:hypothetical protein